MEILKVSALNKVYVQGDKHIYAVHDAWLSVKKGNAAESDCRQH